MVECWLPYGKTEVPISIDIRDLLGVAEPEPGAAAPDPAEVITEALQNPIDARPLGETVEPNSSVAIGLEGTLDPRLAAVVTSSLIEQFGPKMASRGSTVVVIGNGCREQSEPELLEALRDTEALQGIKIVEHVRGSVDSVSLGATSM
ncbi:MAG: lactate racemase domain-containing protein, partial [Candidatus Bathyarchaeia archaeon]